MNNVGSKYLALGTVVMLKGASKRLMITGFCTMAANDESGVMYDYSGCLYPEGVISSEQTALFNHDQIEKIYHMGLVDDEEKNFKIKLNQLVNSQSVVSATTPQSIRNQDSVVPPVAGLQTPQQPSVTEQPMQTQVAQQPSAPVQPPMFNTMNFNQPNNNQ